MGRTFSSQSKTKRPFQTSNEDERPFKLLKPTHEPKHDIEREQIIHFQSKFSPFMYDFPAPSHIQEKPTECIEQRCEEIAQEFHKLYPENSSLQKPYLYAAPPLVDSHVGIIMSNILMAALIQEIKRTDDTINFTLYTQSHINYYMLCNKSNKPQFQKNPYLEANIQAFEQTIHEWIQKSNICTLSSPKPITRTAILLHFAENFIDNPEEASGHEILLLATRFHNNNRIHFQIIDNLDRDYYYDTPPTPSVIELCQNFIQSAFPSSSSILELSIECIKNDLPYLTDKDYTCMSLARRAAIYAAITKNISDMSTIEQYPSTIFEQNFQLYNHHMQRMIHWYYSDDTFWQTQSPIVITPPECFIAHDVQFFDPTQKNMVVELTPEIAYIIVYDMSKPPNHPDRIKKMFFTPYGNGPFAQIPSSLPQQSVCTVSSEFKDYI